MAEEKKFLDYDGVAYLWSKISMEDYPNNETLIAVLNAIDDTKADKTSLIIDYDANLAFDTTEIVFNSNTSNVLGQAILGQLILG